MRKKTYIFRKKPREGTSRAAFMTLLGLLVLTPPAIAQSPGLRPAHHVAASTQAHRQN